MKKQINNKDEKLLKQLSLSYFEMIDLDQKSKKEIFSKIKKGLKANKSKLKKLIVSEVKLTENDAEKEIERAYKTFSFANENTNYLSVKEITRNGKRILEKRIARGPLLVITPFSSPLSSPAHKISLGIIAGTSILFKPSGFAKETGKLLFEIIKKATNGKYIYYCGDYSRKEMETIIRDERIGIISFTGGYETGKKIIQSGGVKKYHMELAGGNSSVIFSPEYKKYDDLLTRKLLDGILAKNGQRCVSIKHIFIHKKESEFILKICGRMLALKQELIKDISIGNKTILGPLITETYARETENKVKIVLGKNKNFKNLIKIERSKALLFPTIYSTEIINTNSIKDNLSYDLPGPVVFVYLYKNKSDYEKILAAFKNDYVQSGLQLSLYTENSKSIKDFSNNLLWGGIIVNDIPTFRDEFMSFGGFGKSGLGKEGFFETLNVYTDPQVIVQSS
jgi:acyl-CoA reductase-like NAD-dependent aldehyde dehydrogenase